MGRQIVLDGLLESPDTEVLFFGARRHMCLMCTHVAHQAHRQIFEKKFEIFKIFWTSKIFQNFFPDKPFPKIGKESSHFDPVLV